MIRQFNRATPIVAVTPNTKPSHVMSYFTAGMNDVLGKPFARAEVLELLEVRYIPVLAILPRYLSAVSIEAPRTSNVSIHTDVLPE